MCDIDHFKAINDQHGHVAGDDVLREFGDRLSQGLRLGEDWVARIGGEEFAIVLPETGRFQAHAIAERLRQAIAARPMSNGQPELTITASFGFCSLEEAYPRTPELKERMVVAADDALYRSKRSGRNRVSEVVLRLTAD
jgi:two-component system cell cycle response regulator